MVKYAPLPITELLAGALSCIATGLLLLAACWLISPRLALAAPPITPEKTITIVTEDIAQPRWKTRWDAARELVQQQDYESAIAYYLEVLTEKPHIEAVKWELCRVLITVGDYDQATLYLESLLELDSTRREYLISAGNLALIKGNNEQAVQYFGQVLEQDPLADDTEQALSGLIQALKVQGKAQLAIPLMEQLYQRGNAGSDLLLDLARTTKQSALLEKASHYYAELVKKFRVSPEVIGEAADLFEQTGRIEQAAQLWRDYLELRPDHLLYREKLADFHTARREPVEALPHLLYLLENGVNRRDYLLRVAKINLYNVGRADRALSYYEQYQNEFPDGTDVSSEIADIQMILANDLLTIVENNGAWLLWRDLARVTPDRIGIYRAMATLLEELGRKDELLEVLKIIVRHAPGDRSAVEKLATIYLGESMYEQCRSLLRSVGQHNDLSASLYLLRARCELGLGQDIDGLQSYLAYLRLKQEDKKVRLQAIRLAGKLGRMEQLDELLVEADDLPAPDLETLLAYLEALFANHRYTTARRLVESKYPLFARDGEASATLQRKKAESLFMHGNWLQAEKVLRQSLTIQPDTIDALLLLTDHALRRSEMAAAASWLAVVEKIEQSGVGATLTMAQKRTLFNRQVRLQWLTGDRNQAMTRTLDYFSEQKPAKQIVEADVDTLLFLLKNLGRDHRRFERDKIAVAMRQFKTSSSIQTLYHLVDTKQQRPRIESASEAGEQLVANLPLGDRLDVIQLLIRLEQYQKALDYLDQVSAQAPESLRAQVLTAQALFDSQAYQKAYHQYQLLSQAYGDEYYFRHQLDRLEYLLGYAPRSEQEPTLGTDFEPSTAGRVAAILESDPSSATLRKALDSARGLWTADRWDDALTVYETLYATLHKQLLATLAAVKATDTFQNYFPHRSRNSIPISAGDEVILDEIMSPSFFVRHRDDEISRLSADAYDIYRWWKIVKKEREAKVALNAREFYQAERKYQELHDLDANAAEISYPDLVTIYSRLGKRQKETELHEKLKDTKREVPDLKEAAEKNIRQQQPHLSLDTSYREEKGREGSLDVTQVYAGANVQFTPTLFHEAGAWFGRSEYGNSEASTLAKSVHLSSRYAVQFNDYLEGEAKLGLEDFDNGGESFLLFDVTLRGKLEEKVNVFFSLNQNPVADTPLALTEGISKKQFQAGLSIEHLPRLFMGFDFSLQDFSDENDGREFNLFASYRFFLERSSLDISYRYQQVENSIANEPATGDSDRTAALVPYWSPDEFWKHMVSGEYRIELWPTGRLQSGTSYVATRYGIGLEKGDTVVQNLDINIFLELSPIFLVKGTLWSHWSDDYDHNGVSASLAYRW